MEFNDKQKKILDILKNGEELATTKISFLISANLYQTEAYLDELKDNGLIIKSQKNNATYWRLNNGGSEREDN